MVRGLVIIFLDLVSSAPDTKGQAHMMFLHRDNHMQNKEYIQSGTLKILLISV